MLALTTLQQPSQTPVPPIPTSPKDPLPELTINFADAQVKIPAEDGDTRSPDAIEFTGDVRLVCGAIALRADRLIYKAKEGKIEGTGNVVLTRGVETVRGSAITIFLFTGDFVVQNGVVVSPPLRVSGERVERVDGVLRAYRSKITPDPDGNGELQLLAREVRIVEGAYTDLSDVRIYVYGTRLLTIPRYRIRQEAGKNRSEFVRLPIRAKVSRISGFALGLGNTWDLARNLTGDVEVFFPTRNGPQYTLTANYDLFGTANSPAPYLRRRQRDSLFNTFSTQEGRNESQNAPSSLRRLLTLRPSPGPDPVLDFEPILGTNESVGRPLAIPPKFATLSMTLSGKEEVGIKRQGNLLVSRVPEIRLRTSLPISSVGQGIEFETNEAARRFLRIPRFAATADLSAGEYHETRLSIANPTLQNGNLAPNGVDSDRFGGTVGINMLPFLLGNNILLRSQASYSQFSYENGFTYRIQELGVSASYIFNRRTMIGGAVYQRTPSGHTPFFFDQIDTRSEAQGIVQGRISNRVTAALLLRYDLGQSRLFDYGVTIGIRGKSLEPRFGYRKLGGQFSLGFGIVGF